MILYCAQTNYQLLECITHKMNYNSKEMAVIIYHEVLPARYGIKEDQLLNIFDEIYAYPIREFPSNWDTNQVKSVGNKVFGYINGRRLEEFDDIYIAGTYLWFGVYATLCGISYNYFEDACHTYWERKIFLKNIYKGNAPYGKVLDELEIVSADNPCVQKIYTNIPPGKVSFDSRVTHYDMLSELTNIDKEQVNKLYKVYGIDSELFQEIKNSDVLLLTNPFCLYENISNMSIETQKKLYTRLVDYFLPNQKICVKPHPSDLIEYGDVFPRAVVVSRFFPIEILFTDEKCRKLPVVSIFSAGSHLFPNKIEFNIPVSGVNTFMSEVYMCDLFKDLYNNLLHEYRIKTEDNRLNILANMGLNAKDCVDDSLVGEKNFFWGDHCLDFNNMADTMEQTDFVIFLDETSDKVWNLLNSSSMNCVIKKISIKKLDGTDVEKKYMYFFTDNICVKNKIMEYAYEKDLINTKERVVVEKLDEQKLEYNALKGMLIATEKKLRQVLEENEMLKAQLSDTNTEHKN